MVNVRPFYRLLTDHVIVEKRTGLDTYGQPEYALGTKHRASVQPAQTSRKLDVHGESFTPRFEIYFSPPVGISPGDRLTFSDGSEWTVKTCNVSNWVYSEPHHEVVTV